MFPSGIESHIGRVRTSAVCLRWLQPLRPVVIQSAAAPQRPYSLFACFKQSLSLEHFAGNKDDKRQPEPPSALAATSRTTYFASAMRNPLRWATGSTLPPCEIGSCRRKLRSVIASFCGSAKRASGRLRHKNCAWEVWLGCAHVK